MEMLNVKIKLAILGYEGFAKRAVKYTNYLNNVDVNVYSSFGCESVPLAKKLESSGIDAILTGRANYIQLKDKINIPIIPFKVTFTDIIKAFKEVEKFGHKKIAMAYSSFDDFELNFNILSDLFGLDIVQISYVSKTELEDKIKSVKNRGIKILIGTTMAVEISKGIGITGIEIYSVENVIINSIDKAVEVIRVIRENQSKEMRDNAILNYAYEGIISIDEFGRIQVFNDAASKIFGIKQLTVIGEHIDKVLYELKLSDVLKNGKMDINSIEKIKGIQVAVNKIPIMIKEQIVGAVATFQDVNYIDELGKTVKKGIKLSGFYAKHTFEDLIGRNQKFIDIVNISKKYAKTDLPILIEGETGTGKELFAQSIHNYSSRKNYPFVAINCASLPENLLESELFGYEPGAFTGASGYGKKGLFEIADSGTLFLDEINSIPKSFQVKLLRAIEEEEIIKVGGKKVIPVDIRIIASTNVSIKTIIKENLFREDLYYRIGTLKIMIPPLRERISDLPYLVSNLSRQVSVCHECKDFELNNIYAKICEKLKNYLFPGNIRELKSFLQRFFILIDEDRINDDNYINLLIDSCLDEVSGNQVQRLDYSCPDSIIYETEKKVMINLLNKYENNKTLVAKHLGIGRNTLYRKLKKLGIFDSEE